MPESLVALMGNYTNNNPITAALQLVTPTNPFILPTVTAYLFHLEAVWQVTAHLSDHSLVRPWGRLDTHPRGRLDTHPRGRLDTHPR